MLWETCSGDFLILLFFVLYLPTLNRREQIVDFSQFLLVVLDLSYDSRRQGATHTNSAIHAMPADRIAVMGCFVS
jgi:hypothetical protein